ncbi:hypothetical protein [Microbacterium sp. TPD7012]|uniref:hypothetical protein n=1 Tax=Microbacterium sp. TPD7012 TaxID=2171975 RepID=UPI000D509D2F|nr:hypothetical protein [Microbacterium sp. TPD7012]PVE95004.1 hypothetical protein DC434_13850 [Microbacterium sp. TPD7012]
MTEAERADATIDRVVQATKVTDNTAQEVIEVTRDKVELALHRNLHKYVPAGEILAWTGLTITLLTTMLTAEFQPSFGMSGDTWRGVFILAFWASVFPLVRGLVRLCRRPKIDDLVNAIERDSRSASS